MITPVGEVGLQGSILQIDTSSEGDFIHKCKKPLRSSRSELVKHYNIGASDFLSLLPGKDWKWHEGRYIPSTLHFFLHRLADQYPTSLRFFLSMASGFAYLNGSFSARGRNSRMSDRERVGCLRPEHLPLLWIYRAEGKD